jgi:hypothetical protein
MDFLVVNFRQNEFLVILCPYFLATLSSLQSRIVDDMLYVFFFLSHLSFNIRKKQGGIACRPPKLGLLLFLFLILYF